MSNTTFSGPVRSEGGFETITKTDATGVVTTNFDVNSSGSLILCAGLTSPTGLAGGTNTSKTQLANASTITLAKNTIYLAAADGNACTNPLPAIADSTAGDVIIVEYQNVMVNGQTQKFGTSGEFFMAKSAIYRLTGTTGLYTVDVADGSADDFLSMIGLSNAGPGVGSYIIFSFNGTGWRAEARLTASGTGAVANLSVFGT